MDSFYIEDNHSPIVTKEVWEQVQLEMKKRAEEKGNYKGSSKGQNRYPLTGKLFCSKCGSPLRRRTELFAESVRGLTAERSGIQRMKGFEGLFGDAILSMGLRAKLDVRVGTSMMGFYIRLMLVPIMQWLKTRITS